MAEKDVNEHGNDSVLKLGVGWWVNWHAGSHSIIVYTFFHISKYLIMTVF